MNSSLVFIGILGKISISKHCLIKSLNHVSSNTLRRCLGLTEVYDGNANKKRVT